MSVNSNYNIVPSRSQDNASQVSLDKEFAQFFSNIQQSIQSLPQALYLFQRGRIKGLTHEIKTEALRIFLDYGWDLTNAQSQTDKEWVRHGKVSGRAPDLGLGELPGKIEQLLSLLEKGSANDFVREREELKSLLEVARVAPKSIDVSALPFYLPREFKEWALTSRLWRKLPSRDLHQETLHKIDLVVMRAFQKISSFPVSDAIRLELPSTPLRIKQMRKEIGYHRMGESECISLVDTMLGKYIGLDLGEALAVSSTLFEECLARISRNLEVPHQPRTLDELRECLTAIANIKSITHVVPLNVTHLVSPDRQEYHAIQNLLKDFDKSLEKGVCFYIWNSEQEFPWIMIPSIYMDAGSQKEHVKLLNNLRAITGFCVSPDQAYALQLRFASLDALLGPLSRVNLQDDDVKLEPIHIGSYRDFCNLAQPKLSAMSEASQASYGKIFADGTLALVRGLEGLNIEQKFADQGLTAILQSSYQRILKALDDSHQRLENLGAFIGAMEIVHQEIQNILMVAEPYGPQDFAKAELASLRGLLPEGLNPSVIQVKPSGMRCLASLISAIEAQNGGKAPSMLMQKDVYYEMMNLPGYFAQQSVSWDPQERERLPAKNSVELYLCEIHHNASDSIGTYTEEKVLDQIHLLLENEVFTRQFTVAIDTTICSKSDPELKNILNDPLVKQLIAEGRLSLVLLRSAQKFDMLGFDNYYGGVITAFNNPEQFNSFNTRLADPQDQLEGLSYQGLTHLQMHAAPQIEEYRQALMERTTKLYRLMPNQLKHDQAPYPRYAIAKRKDQSGVFLVFKNGQEASVQLKKAFQLGKIQLMDRPSFGFPLPSMSILHEGLRLCPGLETDEGLKAMAQIFIDAAGVNQNDPI